MERIALTKLYTADYDCTAFNAMRQQWISEKSFSCFDDPKSDCLLIFLDGYTAVYTLKDGKKICVPDGSVIYTATQSEYKVVFTATSNKKEAHTTSIRFHLLISGERIRLDRDFFYVQADATLKTFFEKINLLSLQVFRYPSEYKALLFPILTELGKIQQQNNRSDLSSIERGFQYLNEHYYEEVSVEQLARMCYMTSVWFRKLFKQYTGMSPVEYKIELRLTQARNLLQYGNMSIQEISESIGYFDISLFIRLFKKKYSLTPLQFRKQNYRPRMILT